MLVDELGTLEAESFEAVRVEDKPMTVAATTLHCHTDEDARA